MSRFARSALVGIACYASPVLAGGEQSVVVTTKPRFVQHGDSVFLIVSNASNSFDISWAMPGVQFVPLSLDTNQVYTFTVHQKRYSRLDFPELHRVELNGHIIYDVELCEVHKTRMEHKEVRIIYGLVVPVQVRVQGGPPADTARKLFPHCREDPVEGGCVVTPDSPKTEKVYVCSGCKQAFEWWSGTATAPQTVLPRDTRYDHDQHLRLVFLESFGKGYVAAWARKESLPVFAPTTEDDKARVFGYVDGAAAGRAARDAWSGANGQPYGPRNSWPTGKR